MDSPRGRHHHSFRPHKATSPHSRYHETNHCNTQSNHGIFRPRIQKHTLKWRKDYYHRGNCRSRLPYKKTDFSYKRPNKNPEDEEEEERKKKLNDTAKKLLSKIKTWNAEKNCSEDDSQQNNINEVVTESSCKHSEEIINSEGQPKRMAHSKKPKIVKSRTRKSFTQPSKTLTRYDVNKETVKDFQNRIQHKLIEDIMQMPKENLQNVLNDPKINPIMEKKMSRLVRENKPLIAQRLRALAESKMKSLDYTANPQLLDDIDKLIDPVIETDLSALPYELIKQMENIFQVQFDYSQYDQVSQAEGAKVCESAIENMFKESDIPKEINNFEQVAEKENCEDLSLYECSTDEDEEISARKSVEFDSEHNLVQQAFEVYTNQEKNRQSSLFYEPLGSNDFETHSLPLEISANNLTQNNEDTIQVINCLSSDSVTDSGKLKQPIHTASKSMKFTSTSCQTDDDFKDSSTQTETIVELKTCTCNGVLVPDKASNESISSLLNEVNSIQSLVNKLNERRLMIFLQLAKMNPSQSFISDDVTKNNFIESISNGSFCLLESLKQFFSVNEQSGSSGSESNNKSRNLEEKRGSRH